MLMLLPMQKKKEETGLVPLREYEPVVSLYLFSLCANNLFLFFFRITSYLTYASMRAFGVVSLCLLWKAIWRYCNGHEVKTIPGVERYVKMQLMEVI